MSEQTKTERQYDKGIGFYADGRFKKAAKWYRKAADQGYASAQNNLALMYENGQGVTQSYPEAVKWYRLAADQGYAYAKYRLAELGACK